VKLVEGFNYDDFTRRKCAGAHIAGQEAENFARGLYLTSKRIHIDKVIFNINKRYEFLS